MGQQEEVVVQLSAGLAFALTEITGAEHSTRPQIVPKAHVAEILDVAPFCTVEYLFTTNEWDADSWQAFFSAGVQTPGPGYDLLDRSMAGMAVYKVSLDSREGVR